MVAKILCVAEKPSIAKAVANCLGSTVRVHNISGSGSAKYVKNYEFDFTFSAPWGTCPVVMTSVAGHVKSQDFESRVRGWSSCDPSALFDATIETNISDDKKAIAKNIESQARYAKGLFIWTDCDREGEHIGNEIREIAFKGNRNLDVKRARFSNVERAHVIQAAKNPSMLDERQINAVSARIELDLRIGASFTRMLTMNLKPILAPVQELSVISYGPCQFPTLGFVVDRYFRVKNFIPETFWKIQVFHERGGIRVAFNWSRVHLFDRMLVTILFERCINAGIATVSKLTTKPTSKWRPLPLTTVELQKCGSRFLHLDSQTVMNLAEGLYQKGFISYPRTETDQFDSVMDLRALIQKQAESEGFNWHAYARGLLDGSYRTPRNGRNNDQAHPPIHPVNPPASGQLRPDEKRVYEFVVRRFLAACSDDARGESTTVELMYGEESFTAHGLVVVERNYLEVYPYDKWESSRQLPLFQVGETFTPTEANMTDGKTTPPGYLTEPELIALMDSNGIGTDATMAEHIATIKQRQYVLARPKAGTAIAATDADEEPTARGGGRGRGRGRGRGGTYAANNRTPVGSTGGVSEFIPTTLGVALIEGYDKFGFETSLSKPFLRKEIEDKMRAICAGTVNKSDVVQEGLEKYRAVFHRSVQQVDLLKASVRQYCLGQA